MPRYMSQPPPDDVPPVLLAPLPLPPPSTAVPQGWM